MNKVLKVFHLLGLAAFVGSIFGHILLGGLGDPTADLIGFAALAEARYMNVLLLTLPGLALLLFTGIALAWRYGLTPKSRRWLGAKLLLVGLIALNGVLVLTPLGRDMAALAQDAVATGSLPAAYFELQQIESLFGAANLAMILVVVALATAKPRLVRKNGVEIRSGEAVA